MCEARSQNIDMFKLSHFLMITRDMKQSPIDIITMKQINCKLLLENVARDLCLIILGIIQKKIITMINTDIFILCLVTFHF